MDYCGFQKTFHEAIVLRVSRTNLDTGAYKQNVSKEHGFIRTQSALAVHSEDIEEPE